MYKKLGGDWWGEYYGRKGRKSSCAQDRGSWGEGLLIVKIKIEACMWDMAQERHRLAELRKMAEKEWKLGEQKRTSSQKKLEWNFSGRRDMSTGSDAMKSQTSKMNLEEFEQKKIFGKESRFWKILNMRSYFYEKRML